MGGDHMDGVLDVVVGLGRKHIVVDSPSRFYCGQNVDFCRDARSSSFAGATIRTIRGKHLNFDGPVGGVKVGDLIVVRAVNV
jgi:hypothetical protein